MIALQISIALVRELLRALFTPFRLLAYLPMRHSWQRIAADALRQANEQPDPPPIELVRKLRAKTRSRATGTKAHLFISAGEASGEGHAMRLVQALQGEPIRFTAFGGEKLQSAGATIRFPLSEHAVMGFIGVLQKLPLIVRAYGNFLRMLRDDRPDLVVLVDYPGLHLVMAKACHRLGVPVLHYVAPQYWAWGPWRMRRYRRSVDATLTILPFETTFFRKLGVPAYYIGHPLLDELQRAPADPIAVASVKAKPTLCLLPGSRRSEIEANLPGMLRTAERLRALVPDLRVVLPHRDPRRTPTIRALLEKHHAVFVEHQHGPLAPWLKGARLVLAKSGTGSLEACLHGTPVVVVYQLRGLLSTIGYHNILSVPYIAAANLIANRLVIPEFCFHRSEGWDRVFAAVQDLWHDGSARDACCQGLDAVRKRLGKPGATDRAATLIRAVLLGEQENA
ncbi:MAG: lipid-A-disaccharide synthase [Planctomycetes bacterium]|nr:lipid-A-disaccharide synthase [Planctomycetota bacterium]